MFPLYEALPRLHTQLRGEATSPQGEKTLTSADKKLKKLKVTLDWSLCIFSLLQQGGVLSLIDCTLIEEPDASDEECKLKQCVHVNRHTSSSYWLIYAFHHSWRLIRCQRISVQKWIPLKYQMFTPLNVRFWSLNIAVPSLFFSVDSFCK